MSLLELPAEILCSILDYCDAASVVSAGQTCRYLHTIAFDKTVWLNIIEDVKRRSILDHSIAEDPTNLSTPHLILLVKSLIGGPETWSPNEFSTEPELLKEIVLHPEVRLGPGILHWENETRLLRDGTHAFFNNWGRLECWNVAQDRLVWKQLPSFVARRLCTFAVEKNDGTELVTLVLCERTYESFPGRKNSVEIAQLDLRSGTHRTLMKVRARDTDHDGPFLQPVICGPVASVYVHLAYSYPQTGEHLLINWKEQKAVGLTCKKDSLSHIKLLPNYIIMHTISTDGNEDLHFIYSDDIFTPLPNHVDAEAHQQTSIREDELLKKVTQRLHTRPSTWFKTLQPQGWRSDDRISVHESPVRRGTYRLWIYTNLDRTLASYDFTLDSNRRPDSIGELNFRVRSRVHTRPEFWNPSITYSGHSYCHPGRRIVHPVLGEFMVNVELQGSGDEVDVAPYSGAIAYSTAKNIIIRYFK